MPPIVSQCRIENKHHDLKHHTRDYGIMYGMKKGTMRSLLATALSIFAVAARLKEMGC
jgi:hypothetical protein